MTGETVAQPSSPRDGEDISITAGLPKVCYFLEYNFTSFICILSTLLRTMTFTCGLMKMLCEFWFEFTKIRDGKENVAY